MFRKGFTFYNERTRNNEQDISLIISFSISGFTVIQHSITEKVILEIDEYSFESSSDVEKDKHDFRQLINDYLQLPGINPEIKVIQTSGIYTPVPGELFDERKAADFVGFIANEADGFDNQVLAHHIHVQNFYIVSKNLKWQSELTEGSPFEKSILNDIVVFVSTIMNSQQYYSGTFIQVGTNYFDVLIIKQKSLLLLNRFNFATSKDFCYHLVGAMKAVGLNVFDETLYLSGEILPGSEITSLLAKYLSAIHFLNPENSVIPDNLYAHRYFNQLSVL
jgi:hypothetical protein